MTTITIQQKELKTVVKEVLREALHQEFLKLQALLLPLASAKEQKNIEKLYGKPSRKIAKSVNVRI